MSEERDRLERAKAKMNELTLGREYDAAWRAVLSALEAAKAEMERRERDTALAYPGAVPGHWKAHAERQQQRAEAAEARVKELEDNRAVIADLRAEVERLKAEVAALREQAAGAEGLRKSMYALEARVDKLRAERDELKRQLVVAEAGRDEADEELGDMRAEVERLKQRDEQWRVGAEMQTKATDATVRERDESRARAARLEMALRGQATRLLPDGGVCYCDIQRSDECRNEPPCVEARAALASGESREGETK